MLFVNVLKNWRVELRDFKTERKIGVYDIEFLNFRRSVLVRS